MREEAILFLLLLFSGDGVMTVQYWRSFEELAAHNKNLRHVSSTKHYWAELEDLGVVSIWHETYMIVPGMKFCKMFKIVTCVRWW